MPFFASVSLNSILVIALLRKQTVAISLMQQQLFIQTALPETLEDCHALRSQGSQ